MYSKCTSFFFTSAIIRWGSNCRPAPLLTISSTRSLIDEQVTIEGRYLPPFCRITMRACLHSEDGDLWETLSHYNTDKNGRVNCEICYLFYISKAIISESVHMISYSLFLNLTVTRDVSLGGSYVGCEPMGLFWSLQPAHGGRKGLRWVTDKLNISHTNTIFNNKKTLNSSSN